MATSRVAQISASVMCADFLRLDEQLAELQQAGVDLLHVDVMDGAFVPNFTLGPDFVAALRRGSSLPMDVHLMVNQPERHLASFEPVAGDIISVHQEATVHLQRTLSQIRELGARAGVALNPSTPITTLDHVLDDLDVILVMTVNPGFAGQRLVPATLHKIAELKQYLETHDREQIAIEVDGNVSFDNARRMRAAGAEIFVAGTSSVFRRGAALAEGVDELRKSLEQPISLPG